MTRPAIKETELSAPVVSWLSDQHWNVYQEVQFSYGAEVADIVAERDGILWIIECKTSYGLAVLEQASKWPVHYRSIAVPRSRSDRNYRVARDYYCVGVIEVNCFFEPKEVREEVPPKIFARHRRTARLYLDHLTELHKSYSVAGSRGGSHLTPYKATMIEARKVIQENPGCTIGFLHSKLGNMHYASKASFKGNMMVCLARFEAWCKIDRTQKPYRLYVEEE